MAAFGNEAHTAMIPSHRGAEKKEQMFKFDMRMNGCKINLNAQLMRDYKRMERLIYLNPQNLHFVCLDA